MMHKIMRGLLLHMWRGLSVSNATWDIWTRVGRGTQGVC